MSFPRACGLPDWGLSNSPRSEWRRRSGFHAEAGRQARLADHLYAAGAGDLAGVSAGGCRGHDRRADSHKDSAHAGIRNGARQLPEPGHQRRDTSFWPVRFTGCPGTAAPIALSLSQMPNSKSLDGTFAASAYTKLPAYSGKGDITAVAQPQGLDAHPHDGSTVKKSVRGIVYSGGNLYVADEPGNALKVYDLPDPPQPSSLSGTTGAYKGKVTVMDHYISYVLALSCTSAPRVIGLVHR